MVPRVATADDAERESRRSAALAPTSPPPSAAPLATTYPPTPAATAASTSTRDPPAAAGPVAAAGDDAPLVPGDLVARYRVEAVLGRGGMGVVYRARDPDLDRALAIKLVRSRHRGGDRMLREAQAMARLDHPNVVPIFDVGMRGEQVFLVMPLLARGTLGDWCRAKPRPWREVVARYLAAGRGLQAAHRAGIIHRDFKPDNVLLGSRGEVQVADFGLARAHSDSAEPGFEPPGGALAAALTRVGELLGTPAYMAPEQLEGLAVDARADQFSFCVALHEGLYGVRPFELPAGAGLHDLRSALRSDRVRAAAADRQVPGWLRDALVRGLRHDPEARWPTLDALLGTLERGLRRRLPSLTGAGVGIGVAAAAAVAALVAGGVWFALSGGSAPGPPAGKPAADLVLATGGPPLVERQLTFRGDVQLAALSPDGTLVAAVAGGDVILVPMATGAEPRTLVRQPGVITSLAWSADGGRLLVVSPVDVEQSILRIVDVASGAIERLERSAWMTAAWSGPREIASVGATVHDMRLTPLDQDVPSRRCPLPGEYQWVEGVVAAGSALFVLVTHHDHTFSLLRTDRTCIAPRVVLDHVADGHVVVDHDGSHVGVRRRVGDVWVLERVPVAGGAALRSNPLPASADVVLGRTPAGQLLATTKRTSWRLLRIDASAGAPAAADSIDPLAVGTSETRLLLSPERARVARIDSRDGEAAALRVVPLDRLDARPAPIATGVGGVAWSPDGTRLAAVVQRDDRAELVAIEVATGASTTLPVGDLSQTPAVRWLDDRRIAYLRVDNATFSWIDRDSHQIGTTVDAALGWTFDLAVSPADGALAVVWERPAPDHGVYVVPPGAAPVLVARATGQATRVAWTPDGASLWIYDLELGTIDRYDRATGKTERLPTMALDAMTIAEIAPLADGGALVQTMQHTVDLVVLE